MGQEIQRRDKRIIEGELIRRANYYESMFFALYCSGMLEHGKTYCMEFRFNVFSKQAK
jgi:hypothetical protein